MNSGVFDKFWYFTFYLFLSIFFISFSTAAVKKILTNCKGQSTVLIGVSRCPSISSLNLTTATVRDLNPPSTLDNKISAAQTIARRPKQLQESISLNEEDILSLSSSSSPNVSPNADFLNPEYCLQPPNNLPEESTFVRDDVKRSSFTMKGRKKSEFENIQQAVERVRRARTFSDSQCETRRLQSEVKVIEAARVNSKLDLNKLQCVQKIWSGSDIKRARRASRKGNFEKSIFCRKFHPKNLKNDQFSEPDQNFRTHCRFQQARSKLYNRKKFQKIRTTKEFFQIQWENSGSSQSEFEQFHRKIYSTKTKKYHYRSEHSRWNLHEYWESWHCYLSKTGQRNSNARPVWVFKKEAATVCSESYSGSAKIWIQTGNQAWNQAWN